MQNIPFGFLELLTDWISRHHKQYFTPLKGDYLEEAIAKSWANNGLLVSSWVPNSQKSGGDMILWSAEGIPHNVSLKCGKFKRTKNGKLVYKIQGCRVSRQNTFADKIAFLEKEDKKLDYYLCLSHNVVASKNTYIPSSIEYSLITIGDLDYGTLVWTGKDRKTKEHVFCGLEESKRFVSYLGKNDDFQIRIDVKPQITWFFFEQHILTTHAKIRVDFDGQQRNVRMERMLQATDSK